MRDSSRRGGAKWPDNVDPPGLDQLHAHISPNCPRVELLGQKVILYVGDLEGRGRKHKSVHSKARMVSAMQGWSECEELKCQWHFHCGDRTGCMGLGHEGGHRDLQRVHCQEVQGLGRGDRCGKQQRHFWSRDA